MNIKPLAALGLLAGLGYFLFSKKSLSKSTKFSFEKIGFDLKKKRVVVTLGILNPTGSTSDIKSLVGSLSLQGNEVATITSFDNTRIIPNGKTFFKVYLQPSANGLFTVTKNLILSKAKDIKKLQAVFTGTANIDGFPIPINTKLG